MTAQSLQDKKRLHILVVDDNIDQVRTLTYLLRDNGHLVDYAINGIVGLDIAERMKPDVVLLDIRLPDASGLEVVRRLRSSGALKGTRIVGMTAYEISREDALKAGFDELYRKPVDPRALEELVDGTRAHGI